MNSNNRNRVVFGVTNRNGFHWVWNSTSVAGGAWNTHRVSDRFDTRAEAVAEVQRQAAAQEFANWSVRFDNN